MPPLLLLEQAWEHRTLILATILAFVLAFAARQSKTIATLRADLAARPLVQSHLESSESMHQEKGRVTIVRKYLPAPAATGSCPAAAPQLSEVSITRDPVETAIEKHSASDHIETPICEQPAGPSLDPRARPRKRSTAKLSPE
jgi:hypothetical protein